MNLRRATAIGFLASLVLACTSGESGPSAPAGTAPPAGTNPMPVPTAGASLPYTPAQPSTAGLPARTWLLTPEQYARAVQALLGVAPDISGFDSIPDTGVYPNMSASGVVRVNQAMQYASSAEAVTNALTDAQLRALVPCGKLETSCKNEFLAASARKAFRRPPSAEDSAQYGEIFDLAAASGDLALAFRSVLRAVLTSPYFLYRTEIGAAADEKVASFNLTGPEVASLLAFSTIGGPPDEALLSAAERGELADAGRLKMHITSLLSRPEAADHFAKFLSEWLRLHHFEEVEKFESVFPGFAGVKEAMFAEARGFLTQNGGMQGTLSGLLTTPVSNASSALLAFYESDASSVRGTQRIGLLSLGAVLSKTAKQYLTSPTLRGLFIRDQLLCQHITLPENFTPPPIEAAEARMAPKTTRELYDQHANSPVCAKCHTLIDPLGYALEGFDGAGRIRATEIYQSPSFNAPSAGPAPVITSGALVGTDVDRAFGSYVELAQALSESSWVKECVARQAFRYYFGQLEPDRGNPAVVQGTQALLAKGTLGDLVTSLLSSPSTLSRVR
ncbi:MAG TPA: DUF1588 domain-containing protein [Polyangiaceae bacterium]|nr:DUF1588 domain-containing protein [Polyangiaceae bacterium]